MPNNVVGATLRLAFLLSLVATTGHAAPVEPSQVEVLDGNTIRVAGETFRLVGFEHRRLTERSEGIGSRLCMRS
jgi:hypothetical protein